MIKFSTEDWEDATDEQKVLILRLLDLENEKLRKQQAELQNIIKYMEEVEGKD